MNFHPIADIFPLLGEPELQSLASDIREHGHQYHSSRRLKRNEIAFLAIFQRAANTLRGHAKLRAATGVTP
jgi:hypothetical protein